jgi:hypothetical protein
VLEKVEKQTAHGVDVPMEVLKSVPPMALREETAMAQSWVSPLGAVSVL